ncbi:hypothetical protein CR194_01540 [Salipaludibacillus keqinensis]|jgi:hypothetical protein|uniref:Uncharacterized protein n=1 Tax=Salipaludibacillus keqinensis TaxID=2045207 RepID=A0A323THD3_9BACI|nr:hypothetical protein [Salipaludibacillus keqinensis]PYZ94248.1 hypothetical protein CR194_01540 [Salipaludibacillus keqinensis]
MEGLFNLLIESPLLIFFIIAAILSFVRSRGGDDQEKQSGKPSNQGRPSQQRQPQQRSRTDQDREQEVDWRDIFRQEERPTQPQPTVYRTERSEEAREKAEAAVESLPRDAEKELNKSNRELHERYERIQERKKQAMDLSGEIAGSPIAQKDLTMQRKPKIRLDFSNISRDEAVKGVIWSEILGKPKSRRK